MNAYQKIVCQTYAGGDFAYILATPESWRGESEAAGDTLFLFLMIELSDAEDCENGDIAVQRLIRAKNDIQAVLTRMEELQ